MAIPIVLIQHLFRLAGAINFRNDYSPPLVRHLDPTTMFLVITFLVYFDYMLCVVRVIIMFMHRIAKRSFLLMNGVSGQHCVSVVLIRYLPTDAPYILDRVVDHEGDSLIESSVVHLPSVG